MYGLRRKEPQYTHASACARAYSYTYAFAQMRRYKLRYKQFHSYMCNRVPALVNTMVNTGTPTYMHAFIPFSRVSNTVFPNFLSYSGCLQAAHSFQLFGSLHLIEPRTSSSVISVPEVQQNTATSFLFLLNSVRHEAAEKVSGLTSNCNDLTVVNCCEVALFPTLYKDF